MTPGRESDNSPAAKLDPGTTRMLSFSDGVLSIAITLLVLNIKVPVMPFGTDGTRLWEAVLSTWPVFLTNAISFLVIGLIWISHQRVFKHIISSDSRVQWLNLIFLLTIMFIPYSTSLLGSYPNNRFAVIFYAANLSAAGFTLYLVWGYASRNYRLINTDTHPKLIRYITLTILVPSLIFLVSIGISFIHVYAAQFFWLLIIVARKAVRYKSNS